MLLPWRCLHLQQTTFFLLAVLYMGFGQTQTCPSTCQCLRQSVICKAGNLMNILTNIPRDSFALDISVAKQAFQLEHQHFNQCLAKYTLTDLSLTKSQIWKLAGETFSSLINLQKLNLSHNDIREISNSAFDGLRSLQNLDISNNKLTAIGSPISRLQNLKHFNAAQNNFRTIPSGTFQTMTHLETLILDGNQLSSLQGYSFQGLGKLKHLSLQGCGIGQIPSDLFNIVRRLQILDLRFNHIRTLPNSQDLRNLAFLQKVFLDNNQIHELSDTQFGSISINTLSLSNNQIHTVPTNTFKYFNAKVVDLSFNKIAWLGPKAFQPLSPELTHLNIAGNSLTHIQTGVFKGLYRLEHLNISRCGIQTLPSDDFVSLRQLQVLDMSQNKLQNLSWTVTNRMKSLSLVIIEGNPWHCDCHIQPLRDWLRFISNQKKLRCPHSRENCWEVRCKTPTEAVELPVKQLRDDQVALCAAAVSPPGLSLDNIVIIVSVIVATICTSLSIIVVMWKKQCFKKIFKHNVKPKMEPPYQPYICDQTSVDLGSINESDRGFPLRAYMQALEAMNGQFHDITPTDSNPQGSEQLYGESDFAVETQSRTCSSLPSTVIVGRESAV